MNDVVIVSAVRTPIGSFNGAFAGLSAPQLGAIAIREAVARAGVGPEAIDEVYLGHVLSAGVGQAPARQASIHGGISSSVSATSVNKVCGSGLKAIMLGLQAIRLGDAKCVVAGGMESMSNAPHLLPKSRAGYRLGHIQALDSALYDGLFDSFNDLPMGECGEMCADKLGLTREDQDEFATESYRRAKLAQQEGRFAAEIVPVEVTDRAGSQMISEDEEPGRGDESKLPRLRPAFRTNGTITAGNAPALNDGASALVLMEAEQAKAQGLEPLARIVGTGHYAAAPEWFTLTPGPAIQGALNRTGLAPQEIDLYEVNEAFVPVAVGAMRALGVDHERVNVNGGAVALGHPIGASGARIVTTLVHAMHQRHAHRGVAALCMGGGEGLALVLEGA